MVGADGLALQPLSLIPTPIFILLRPLIISLPVLSGAETNEICHEGF